MNDALAQSAPAQMVPGDFAEKAMASLMQMHTELMDEKERRVELYRKLMEREQAVAELRMYVRLLEEKLQKPAEVASTAPIAEPKPRAQGSVAVVLEAPVVPSAAKTRSAPTAHARAPRVAAPLPPRVARPKIDSWKTW